MTTVIPHNHAEVVPVAQPLPLRPANQQAQLLTGRPYLSFSQITLMRACPKKFALHYVDHAHPAFIPASLIFGSAIHAAVESYFQAKLAGAKTSAADLLQAYRSSWEGQKTASDGDLPIKYAKGQDEAIMANLSQRMIQAFLGNPVSQPPGTLLGVEEQFTVTLDEGLPDVLARVDLVYETPDAIVVRDFKTARSKWNQEKAEESADQIHLYGRVLRDLSSGMAKPMQGEFVVLTKQKTPQIQTLAIPITAEGIRRTHEAIASTWQAVLAGNFYPAPSPMNCSTCQYKAYCPVFGGKEAKI